MVLDAEPVRCLLVGWRLLRILLVDQRHQVRKVGQKTIDLAAEEHLVKNRRLHTHLSYGALRRRRIIQVR